MSAKMAILGLLVEQPLHGYGIEEVVERRGMRKWTPIGFSSIYQLLDQLVADGLARVAVEPAPGRGKERKVHHATTKGRRWWEREALATLSDVDRSVGDFLLAFSGLPLLDPDQANDALLRRRADLEESLRSLERDREKARPVPDHVEAMFEYIRIRLAAECTWLDERLSTVLEQGATNDDH
jgi:DNA-binding PadR family transcriptional regulator